MAFTNSISGSQVNTQVVIDQAFRAVRLAPQQITSEYIQTALSQLDLMLSAWANEGTPLWCQTKYILPLQQGVSSLDVNQFFPGIIDILEANLRNCQRFQGTYSSSEGNAALAFDANPYTACTETTPAGQVTLQLSSATRMTNFGVMPNVSGTWSILLQYSQDGVTWTTFYTNTAFVATAGIFTWLDFQGIRPAVYWRLQAVGTTVLDVAELFFGNRPNEINLSRLNKDDYWTLPDKAFEGRPVQYWCDRQVNGPVMQLWPAPGYQYQFQQITVLAHRYIMDAGSMTNQLELPKQAFEAVYLSLSEKLRMVIVEVDKEVTQDVPGLAKQARMNFWAGNVDDSPMNLQLDISAYTR